jgi:hypothetical protein
MEMVRVPGERRRRPVRTLLARSCLAGGDADDALYTQMLISSRWKTPFSSGFQLGAANLQLLVRRNQTQDLLPHV